MSKVKSFSVGNGDMFYINHNSDIRRVQVSACKLGRICGNQNRHNVEIILTLGESITESGKGRLFGRSVAGLDLPRYLWELCGNFLEKQMPPKYVQRHFERCQADFFCGMGRKGLKNIPAINQCFSYLGFSPTFAIFPKYRHKVGTYFRYFSYL